MLPGFGHTVYKHGDARFAVLLDLFEALADDASDGWWRPSSAWPPPTDPPPNVDLGLAAIAWAAGMPPDAGRTLFTVARVAGWVAHYLEELRERPLRYRARAVYASVASVSRTDRPGTYPRAMALPAPRPDRTCLVTGASSGIGAEIARLLAAGASG